MSFREKKNIMKNIVLLMFFFLFAGCDGKIYKNIYDKSKIGAGASSIEITANDKTSLDIAKNAIKKKGFAIGESDYRVRLEHRDYTKACTNPLSKTSSDYSYEGLLVIELFYRGNKVYSVYQDIKGQISEKHYFALFDIMFDDLELKVRPLP